MDDIEHTDLDRRPGAEAHLTPPGPTFSPGDLIEVTSRSGITYRARVLRPGELPGNILVRVVGDYLGTWFLGPHRETVVWTHDGDTVVKVDCEPDDYLDEPVNDWPGGPRFDLTVTRDRQMRRWTDAVLTEAEQRGIRLPVVWETQSERWTGQDGHTYSRFLWLRPL